VDERFRQEIIKHGYRIQLGYLLLSPFMYHIRSGVRLTRQGDIVGGFFGNLLSMKN